MTKVDAAKPLAALPPPEEIERLAVKFRSELDDPFAPHDPPNGSYFSMSLEEAEQVATILRTLAALQRADVGGEMGRREELAFWLRRGETVGNMGRYLQDAGPQLLADLQAARLRCAALEAEVARLQPHAQSGPWGRNKP